MNLSNYVCDNQMSIFDLHESNNEPPILLKVEQQVYKVVRGDVIEMYVYDEKPWLFNDDTDRGYRLKEKDGCFGVTSNLCIGLDLFTDKEQAHKVAEEHLKEGNCIRKENIKPIKTVAYSYVRECDKRTMIAFYSILDSGMIYVKEFMTYQHICNDVNKAIRHFMDQQEFKYDKPQEIEHTPEFKNMYQCKNDSDWCYAEARYCHY